jgi:hypothetical protein
MPEIRSQEPYANLDWAYIIRTFHTAPLYT